MFANVHASLLQIYCKSFTSPTLLLQSRKRGPYCHYTITFCICSFLHGLRTPSEEIALTARPKIHFHSQIFMYGRSIFCLPHRPKFSDFFDLCLHWVSVVRGFLYRYLTYMARWLYFVTDSSINCVCSLIKSRKLCFGKGKRHVKPI